ncbi:MAG: hypothetical protein A3K19_13650 [Lentisphaerae bacterium RIFOXYB12_FULL_65_16]|nr:MAG: hypothetical protein A3K18_17685 [Lentisphaerae bacterium RIFOXYA12_64_32]OGV94170.1 MAG: hypothetical protein A3K19_13650 [Lentisphaerae bacterium RIFOXYB12_FULL_65_16]
MNIDRMLKTLLDSRVQFLLLGGVNFMLRHQPVLTYDYDLCARRDRCVPAGQMAGDMGRCAGRFGRGENGCRSGLPRVI